MHVITDYRLFFPTVTKTAQSAPIAFASKIIPKGELHRAIIDKEAGAIIFGFKKFYHFIYGHHIILKTDHEPLKFIFGNQKVNTMIHSRLQRWACFLANYQYTIEIVKSKANGNCDALSRLPVKCKLLERRFANNRFHGGLESSIKR